MAQRLEITINRRRYGIADGVKQEMMVADLAGLAGIPPQNAIVERETGRDEYAAVDCTRPLKIEDGMHFLVTRHFVMGG